MKADDFGVAILAAGASRRMGTLKALLPWGETTILEHILATWRKVGVRQTAVVFDPFQMPMVLKLRELAVTDRIANPSADEGMMSSLRAAARWPGWQSECRWIAVALVDQPLISAEAIAALLEHARAHPEAICQPEFAGRHGHPIVLPRADFASLADAPEGSLREFVRARRRSFLSCKDAGVVTDLDTPEDYRAAKERWARGGEA